jgi:hypothetical protein
VLLCPTPAVSKFKQLMYGSATPAHNWAKPAASAVSAGAASNPGLGVESSVRKQRFADEVDEHEQADQSRMLEVTGYGYGRGYAEDDEDEENEEGDEEGDSGEGEGEGEGGSDGSGSDGHGGMILAESPDQVKKRGKRRSKHGKEHETLTMALSSLQSLQQRTPFAVKRLNQSHLMPADTPLAWNKIATAAATPAPGAPQTSYAAFDKGNNYENDIENEADPRSVAMTGKGPRARVDAHAHSHSLSHKQQQQQYQHRSPLFTPGPARVLALSSASNSYGNGYSNGYGYRQQQPQYQHQQQQPQQAASGAVALALPPRMWQPDSAADCCQSPGCGVQFGLLTRRHHCRCCGLLVCGPCSTRTAKLLEARSPLDARALSRAGSAADDGEGEGAGNGPQRMRVCDMCFDTLRMKAAAQRGVAFQPTAVAAYGYA